MYCRTITVAFAILLLPLMADAQTPPAKEAPKESAKEATKEATKNYIPGIEQFMNVIQSEHAKVWYAAQARNWALAAYQLGEIKEIMGDVQDLYPKFKDLPLADMLDAVTTGPIVETEKAVDAKDFTKFSAGYDKLTTACNSCHQATGNGFVVIRRPRGPGFPNQDFSPQK